MKKHYLYFIFLFLHFFWCQNNFAQIDSVTVYDLDFSQLSKIKIVSASKTTQNISEISSTAFVITETQIKENGYFTLEEALSSLPGFQFRNIQGFNSYVFQRGIPNQNNLTLVLIDGVQINELNSGGFYGGGQYNLSNVEQIEVVYGPASVAYGTNAISGVINIITKSAVQKQSSINITVGSFNTLKGNVNYCYANDDKTFGILFSGMFKTTNKANLSGLEGDNNWTNKMENFEDDYSFDLKIKKGNFTFGTNYIQKQTTTTTLTKTVGTIYKDFGTFWNIRFINNYLKYNYNISEKFSLSSIIYNRNATVLDNTIYSVVDTAQIGYYRPNNLTGIENVLNYEVNNYFSVTGGFTFEYEKLAENFSITYSNSAEQNPPTPEKPNMLSNYLASLFVEPRFALSENFFLSAGVRFDQSSIYDQVFTPQAGFSYNYKNNIIRFSYAEAFRAPKPWDYTDGLGNSSLVPEKMRSYEASISSSLFNNLKIDFMFYKNSLESAIVKEENVLGYKWINSGAIKTEGVEVYLRFASKNCKASLNYTFTQSYDLFQNFVPEISKHTGNLSLTYLLSKNFSINVRANYIGKRENPTLIETTKSKFIDPSCIFHGAFSLLNYHSFDIQLLIKNILDAEYYHTSNRDPNRYRQSQRTIMLSVNYSLNY
ncbi:MAG: TonB-dependent receptor [Bacteroidetes bacterium]|nr:TonB-dependent receptor [Bacteroidota bacterium]MBU1114944.1 TonB-dependent receptor [Bacteroidota bacterium]MBU1797844.1 TonB-dependent receptor [Bacteroidota bacterium]